eukprot:3048843-Rhodomonas_salina.1
MHDNTTGTRYFVFLLTGTDIRPSRPGRSLAVSEAEMANAPTRSQCRASDSRISDNTGHQTPLSSTQRSVLGLG